MQQFLHILGQIIGATIFRYFLLASIPFFIFYKILAARRGRSKIQKRVASRKDFIREILYSMQSSVVMSVIAVVLIYTPAKNYTRIYDNLNDYPIWWLWASVAAGLIIHDTYFYWMHRTLHHERLFKLTHLVHHKSTNPSPWAAYSFHFIEAWTEGFVLFVIAFIIPVHPYSILLFTISSFVINVYGHLGYELMPRWFRHSFLFEFVNTSVYHNVHHSKFKGNYGLYFRVWDRLMKTENPDYVKEYDRIQESRFGMIKERALSQDPILTEEKAVA